MKFVCWLWRGKGFWKRTARYDEGHVATLASMLSRHGDHELICVQDGGFDIPGSIIMPDEVNALPDYLPKLWGWSPQFHDLIGERFASIDLDVVVTGDLEPLLTINEPFVIWDRARLEPYNTSLFALKPGYRNDVWTTLSPEKLAWARKRAAYWTGDQSWVAHVLGPDEPTFGEAEGVIQYRPSKHRDTPPEGMKAAFLCGPYEPRSESEHSTWMRKAYV